MAGYRDWNLMTQQLRSYLTTLWSGWNKKDQNGCRISPKLSLLHPASVRPCAVIGRDEKYTWRHSGGPFVFEEKYCLELNSKTKFIEYAPCWILFFSGSLFTTLWKSTLHNAPDQIRKLPFGINIMVPTSLSFQHLGGTVIPG